LLYVICEDDLKLIDLLMENLELSLGGNQVFKEEPDSPMLKRIVQCIKELKVKKK